jgi:hypothetical protein
VRGITYYLAPLFGVIAAIAVAALYVWDPIPKPAKTEVPRTTKALPEREPGKIDPDEPDRKEALEYRNRWKANKSALSEEVRRDWEKYSEIRKITLSPGEFVVKLRAALSAEVGDLTPYQRDLEFISKLSRYCVEMVREETRDADHSYSAVEPIFGAGMCQYQRGAFKDMSFQPKPLYSGVEPRPLFLTTDLVQLVTWGPTDQPWDAKSEKFYDHLRRRVRVVYWVLIYIAESHPSPGHPFRRLLEAAIVPQR